MGTEVTINNTQGIVIKEIFADGVLTEEEIKKAEQENISKELMTELQGKTPDEVNEYVDKMLGQIEEESTPWYLKAAGVLAGALGGAISFAKIFKGGKAALIGGLIGGIAGYFIDKLFTKPKQQKEEIPITHNRLECKANITPAHSYSVISGDNLSVIARKHNVSLSRIRKLNPMQDESKIQIGQQINIPESYSIDGLDIKSTLASVSEYTAASSMYLNDIINGLECKNEGPHLKAYYDGVKDKSHPKGYLTIGFGHTGKVNGKKLKENTVITENQAYRLLAYDVLSARAEAVTFLGEGFTNAPQSIQDAIIDIAYNKDSEKVFDGIERNKNGKIINDNFITDTRKLREDLEQGDYVSAAKHVIYNTDNLGLKKRNVYRVITATRDLSPTEREAVLKSLDSYYMETKLELSKDYPKDAQLLESAWTNAYKGICTGFFN